MRWTAYYTGGRVYHSTIWDYRDLPSEGCLVVVTKQDKGRTIHKGDWFMFCNDSLERIPTSAPGTPWRPRPTGCRQCIKKGALVPDDEFERVYERAWSEGR